MSILHELEQALDERQVSSFELRVHRGVDAVGPCVMVTLRMCSIIRVSGWGPDLDTAMRMLIDAVKALYPHPFA